MAQEIESLPIEEASPGLKPGLFSWAETTLVRPHGQKRRESPTWLRLFDSTCRAKLEKKERAREGAFSP
jgi:hypothetical protein